MKRQPFLAMVCSMVLSAGIFPRVAHSEDEKSLSFGVGLRAGGGYTAASPGRVPLKTVSA